MSKQIKIDKKDVHFNRANQKKLKQFTQRTFWKRWIYFIISFILLALCALWVLNLNTSNNHINTWLNHQRVRTEALSTKQHKKYLNDQSELDTIADFHQMYNNYYLESHPNIKNYHQLQKSANYMKMSVNTAKQNNHYNNQMTNLRFKELKEKEQLPHEYTHSILGNNINKLNTHKFNTQQSHLKLNTVISIILGFFGFISFMIGWNYKKHAIDTEANQLVINQLEADRQARIREFGDDID